VINSALIRQP